MADEKVTEKVTEKDAEKGSEKSADLENAAVSEQDGTALADGENAEAENPSEEGIVDVVQPENSQETVVPDTSQVADEEFDEGDYIDVSAIESELQLLLPNLTHVSETLVEAVELSTQNAEKLKSQESKLIAAFKSLNDFKKEQVKFGTIMLVTTGGIVAVALGLFLAAILSLSGKGEELSALNLALGKRIVELNVGLTSFEEAKAEVATLRGVIETLAVGVEQTQASYSESEQEIQGQLSVYSESLVSELTNQNTTLGESFDALSSKVTAFEAKINSFDSRLQQTDRTLADIQENAKALLEVRDVVEALLVLERERYLDALELRSTGSTEPAEAAEVRRDGEIYFGGGSISVQQ